MKKYPTIYDIINMDELENSITVEKEQEIILAMQEVTLAIESNEATAYIAASQLVLNC